ncbi:hypothetical protein TD95_004331 [Thielaviopsis punctulata]|uniref:Allergen Asp f 4 n=1 Tax=Thielaviopsis punctulata TaxID=72032 RepID=A0A0F4ZM58_9PEZI|nr:hypothetical protein TD95_004331 [Thielaviopsis punctulata]
MQLTQFAVLAGALAAGVSAHPSPAPAHAKAHGQFHERRLAAPASVKERDTIVEVQEFYIAGRPSPVSIATTTLTTSMPPTSTSVSTTSSTPVTTSSSSSSSSSSSTSTTTSSSSSSSSSSFSIAAVTTSAKPTTSSAPVTTSAKPSTTLSSATKTSTSAATTSSATGVAKEFCSSSKKRATLANIEYKGNTGTSDDWGCNIMEIDCSTLTLYDYTAKVSTTGGSYTCAHWNKIGPDGSVDGFWYSALTFSISGDETKCFAFEANTQGGMSCSAGSEVSKTSFGQYAGTWAEYDFGSQVNSGNSGSDVSVLVAEAYDLEYIGMSIKNPSGTLCSSITSTGDAFQAYVKGMEADDGVGCTGYFKGMLTIALGD